MPVTRTLTLNLDYWDELCDAAGLGNDAQVARHLGINQSTVWRQRVGKQPLSAAFIAAVRNSFPEADIDRLVVLA